MADEFALIKSLDENYVIELQNEIATLLENYNTYYVIKANEEKGIVLFGATVVDAFDWRNLLKDMLDFAKSYSPIGDTRKYINSFVFRIDGENYSFESIPANMPKPKEVFMFNFQPYTRKIELSTGFSAQAPTGTFYEVYYDVHTLYSDQIKAGVFKIYHVDELTVLSFRNIPGALSAKKVPHSRYPGLTVKFL